MVAVRIAPRKVNLLPRAAHRPRIVAAVRILLGGIFVYAGQAKIQAPAVFADSIASFRLLPAALSNVLAIGLPPFEVLLGLLLVTGWRGRTSSFCALLTTSVFVMALVSAWVRGIPVDCGCFGAADTPVKEWPLWLLVGRDLLFFTAAAFVYADARHDEPR